MSEYIPIITAIIALIGTFLGLMFGYRKWKSEQKTNKFGNFDTEKQDAYKELWDRVEGFNIKSRLEEINSDVFSTYVQNINAFLLKGSIYIDDADRELVNNYVQAVFEFQKAVKESDIDAAKEILEDTRAIPQSVIEKSQEIGTTQKKALDLREELLKKIKLLLSGKKL